MDTMNNQEPLIFKELPKEQRKALQKEFAQTAESKKTSRVLIAIAVIFAVVVIAGAIIGLRTGHDGYYVTFPSFFICVWPAIISQQKFEKWLAAEKNIVMKKKK